MISKKKSLKAELFNKKASDPKNEAVIVLEALGLNQGQVVADIGSGGGYFTFLFAKSVGEGGKVFAIDTNLDFLEFVKTNAEEKGLNNIETVVATNEKPLLLKKSVDLVFMRNVCHHIQNREAYFRRLRDVLNPDGRVAIVEYRGGVGFSFHSLFGHSVPKETIVKEMRAAGYRLEKDSDFLPEQSFTLFSP